ncbi:MAG: two-component system response regulator [Candidatus Contendobacter sp.]|nr:two-component system response regulator [Candidatus Contendobacter sp.]
MNPKTMNPHKPKILIVDDERFYIDVLVDLLKEDYRTVVAKNGEQALRRAASDSPPDLILLDILMEGMDGYEVCRRLKANPAIRNTPVIFLTIKSEVADELKGFELGAVDYISKPMSPPIVRARIGTHLALNEARKVLADQNQFLERKVLERTEELDRTKYAAIFCMASLVEARDNETGKHLLRTQNYVRTLAEKLKDHPRFAHYLDEHTIELLYKTAPLHDIGKVGVPDRILLKPGKLDPEEWELMKKHPDYGHQALLRAEQEMGTTDFLQLAKEIIYTHHEKWDGSGYPRGLKEDEIPIAGRLMAIADVYDALINRRVYKNRFLHEDAVEMIRQAAGHHFDPDVAEAFLEQQEEFKRIASVYADTEKFEVGS